MLCYTEKCNKFAGLNSASLRPRHTTIASFEEMPQRGDLLATLCPIRPIRDLNLKLPVTETNALPLDQLYSNNLLFELLYFVLHYMAVLYSKITVYSLVE